MKSRRKLALGSTITSVGGSIPMDPASKATVMAAGQLISLLENNSGLPEVNQNYMTKQGGQIIMDLGGEVPAYVEKDEVVTTPKNESFRVQGGTHEDGNDTLMLADPGTEVYSNQIMVKGKTMADLEEERALRSASRLRRAKKIIRKLEKEPDNFMVKAGAQREIQRIKQDEAKDRMERLRHMEVQEILGEDDMDEQMGSGGRLRLGCGGRIKKMSLGGINGIDPAKERALKRINGLRMVNPEEAKMLAEFQGFSEGPDGDYIMPEAGQTSFVTPQSNYTTPAAPKVEQPEQKFDDALGGSQTDTGEPADGAQKSMDRYKVGTRIQGYSNAAAAVMSALNYKPIPDFSAGYGQRGLAENAKAMSTSAIERDMRESDIASGRVAGMNTVRNTSRGINEYLAKALGVESLAQDQSAQSSNQYVTQINDVIARRGQLMDNQDQFMSSGKEKQFTEQERLDDNMIENFATSTKDIGLTEQNIALYDAIQNGDKDPNKLRRALLMMLGQGKKGK